MNRFVFILALPYIALYVGFAFVFWRIVVHFDIIFGVERSRRLTLAEIGVALLWPVFLPAFLLVALAIMASIAITRIRERGEGEQE